MESWKSEIVIPQVNAIAVHVNEAEEIVIRQAGSEGEKDSLVILPVFYADTLIRALSSAVEHIKESKNKQSAEPEKE